MNAQVGQRRSIASGLGFLLLVFASCGNPEGPAVPEAPTYSISVAVAGLPSGSVTVQDAIGNEQAFTSNTTTTLVSGLPSGASYAVTIKTQPASGSLCGVANGEGTLTSDVTISVTCSTLGFTTGTAVTASGTPWDLNGVAYHPDGTFVAVGFYDSGGQLTIVKTTTPSGTWTAPSSAPGFAGLNAVTVVGSRFAAVGEFGTVVVSTDSSASTWTSVNPSSATITSNLNGVATNGTRTVVVGPSELCYVDNDQLTTNTSWDCTTFNADSIQFNDIAYNDAIGRFVAVANGTANQAYYSSDGANWSAGNRVSVGSQDNISVSSVGDELWIMATDGGTDRELYRSVNGTSWTIVSDSDSDATLRAFVQVLYNGSLFLGLPNATGFDRSSDGSAWAEVSGIPQAINDGVITENATVIVGDGGMIRVLD